MATVSVDIPSDDRRRILMVSGFISGVTSASATHFLDVGKVLKQIGKKSPNFNSPLWFRGLPFGAIAQGQRFAVTLAVDNKLREKFDGKGAHWSFFGSMFAAGLGEFLANPPVVIKNYQIAMNMPAGRAIHSLASSNNMFVPFFRGVVPGTLRKAVANALVLQMIGPTRSFLTVSLGANTDKVAHTGAIAFLAGGITGSSAEVMTNVIDRVKTLQQTNPNTRLYQAFKESLRAPFLGAGYAAIRKGAIRATNWGLATAIICMMEQHWRTRSQAHLSCAQGSPACLN